MEAQITRTAIVLVNEVSKNNYGDLIFTDREGQQYKISSKRVQYFEKVIQPDTAVELSYAMSSFGKEYVYSARQVKDALPPPQKPQENPRENAIVKEAKRLGATVIPDKDEIKNRAVALSYAKDAWIAGKIEKDKIYNCADYFLKYMKGE